MWIGVATISFGSYDPEFLTLNFKFSKCISYILRKIIGIKSEITNVHIFSSGVPDPLSVSLTLLASEKIKKTP